MTMFFEGSDEICDRSRYGTWWSSNYPHGDHPNYSKFQFFSHCTIGPRGKLAIIGTSLYGLATFLLTLSMCCDNAFPDDNWPEEVDLEAASVEKFEEDEKTTAIPKEEVFQSSPARSVKSAISVLKGTMIEEQYDAPKTSGTDVDAYNIDPLAIEVESEKRSDRNTENVDVKESHNVGGDENDDISYEQSERMEEDFDDISMDPSRTGETIS